MSNKDSTLFVKIQFKFVYKICITNDSAGLIIPIY